MTDEKVWRNLRQSDLFGLALFITATALVWLKVIDQWVWFAAVTVAGGLITTGQIKTPEGLGRGN